MTLAELIEELEKARSRVGADAKMTVECEHQGDGHLAP